jgi:hypothetical protein
MPFDPRRELPRPEYQAHLAIISGKKEAREKENKKMQNET